MHCVETEQEESVFDFFVESIEHLMKILPRSLETDGDYRQFLNTVGLDTRTRVILRSQLVKSGYSFMGQCRIFDDILERYIELIGFTYDSCRSVFCLSWLKLYKEFCDFLISTFGNLRAEIESFMRQDTKRVGRSEKTHPILDAFYTQDEKGNTCDYQKMQLYSLEELCVWHGRKALMQAGLVNNKMPPDYCEDSLASMFSISAADYPNIEVPDISSYLIKRKRPEHDDGDRPSKKRKV